jgi:hypothetical protein
MAGLFAKLKNAAFSPDTLRHAFWGTLIVWAIVAVGGLLLYFNVGHKPPTTPPSPPSTRLDLPGYFTTLDQLAGRFSEREEFVKSLKGKKVRWRGFVSYVRNSDLSPQQIALAITPTPSDALRIALVYFGEVMRVRLFALREHDSVEITGTFDSENWHTPYIQGDTMQLIMPPPPTPPAPAANAR